MKTWPFIHQATTKHLPSSVAQHLDLTETKNYFDDSRDPLGLKARKMSLASFVERKFAEVTDMHDVRRHLHDDKVGRVFSLGGQFLECTDYLVFCTELRVAASVTAAEGCKL